MKIVVFASLAWSLVNFRGALLAALVERGHHVIACAPDDDTAVVAALSAKGIDYHPIPMKRASISPMADLLTLARITSLLRVQRPDIVLAYTQKPIVYAGLATRLVGGSHFHAMVSGLGHAFSDGGGLARRGLRRAVALLYRVAVRDADSIIVFNRDDGPEMMRWGMISPRHRIVRVPGSGVDVGRFPMRPVPGGPPVFLLVARLLRNKGLDDYAAAARIVKAVAPDVRMLLLGPFDPNPTGITHAELDTWESEGLVEYLGETRDVAPHLAAATVIVLPSRYREGLPRTLLEAMATGRAIVTTDMPGCREPVEAGGNGYLVPPGDPEALAGAMLAFVRDPALAAQMGARSRILAEERFSVDKVNAIIIDTLGMDAAGDAARRAAGPVLRQATGGA